MLFPNYAEEGMLINLPPHGEPTTLWRVQAVVSGDFNERYDHYNGLVLLDDSNPARPIVWNIRRHRCRGFDAHTGALVSSVVYDVGGAKRRNYGPVAIGQGADGQRLACVFGDSVQVHVHAIKLRAEGDSELAWQHYYGEVYKDEPGVALVSHGIVDFNGDGVDETAYSVRDPQRDYRSFVRFRAADTGKIAFELADHWGVGIIDAVGPEKSRLLFAFRAPHGAMPSGGEASCYLFGKGAPPKLIASFRLATSCGLSRLEVDGTNEMLVREPDSSEADGISRYSVQEGALVRTTRTESAELLSAPIVAAVADDADKQLFLQCRNGERPRRRPCLGPRGAGGAGGAGPPAAIMNAINDALSPLGARVFAQPFTPEKILKALGTIA